MHEFMTRLVHLGEQKSNVITPPKVMPIYMSSVFSFEGIDELDKVYDNDACGYVYSRISNPIQDSLSEIISGIDEGQDAQVYATGMAAITMTIISLVKAGDHIISSKYLYGGTQEFFKNQLRKFNVDVTFLDFHKDDIQSHFRENTKIVFLETISNPLMQVLDIKKVSQVAHEHNAKFIVDNTFATPILCQPIKMGADIAVYSATKYLGGHSDIMGGAVVSDNDTINKIRSTGAIYGPTMSSFDGWLLMRSLRTLELRMTQHSNNALKLARFLETHDKIKKVYYPGLESFEYYNTAKKLFRNNLFGGMMSVELKSGQKSVCDLLKELKTIKLVPSLAGVSTFVSYPIKTSHRSLTEEELAKANISPGLLRISTGLENADDIIEEFDIALKKLKTD